MTMTVAGHTAPPSCPHGVKTLSGGKDEWLCPAFTCPPERAKRPEPPATPVKPTRNPTGAPSRPEWLDSLAWSVANKKCALTTTDLLIAHTFTSGAFDYSTGRQTEHRTYPQIAEAAGLRGDDSVGRFFKRTKGAGYLTEIPGSGKRFVEGQKRPTMLHRLSLPEWARKPPAH